MENLNIESFLYTLLCAWVGSMTFPIVKYVCVTILKAIVAEIRDFFNAL